MSFESALYQHLTSASKCPTLNALVGARVYPITGCPSDAGIGGRQYVTWQVISRPQLGHHQGGDIGVAETRVQFNCNAGTLTNAIAVRDALRTDINAYRGALGTTSTVWCDRVRLDEERDESGTPYTGREDVPAWRSVDYIFAHRE